MNETELLERIKKWEDIHTEFKESVPGRNELAKEIVCFAKTDGGQLIIGVTENSRICGVDDLDEKMRMIDDVAFNRCTPPITIIQETVTSNDKSVLVINIPKGSQRPFRTKAGQYYIRATNRCRQASREELLRLFQMSESLYFDETTINKASFSDIDTEYFKQFLHDYIAIEIEDFGLDKYLKNLHCIDDKHQPTIAGLLFFVKNPQKFLDRIDGIIRIN